MGLLIISLALFIGLIVCWIVLPGGTSETITHLEVERVSSTAVEQLA